MATITKQWCSGDADTATISYTFDNTVATGFPHGKLTGISWANSSADPQFAIITLLPGSTSADTPAGTITSLPVSAGLVTPVPSGQPVVVGGVTFIANGNAAVGATSIAVQSQVTSVDIPSGSQIQVPLPRITIPASGQTSTAPALFGGGTLNSTGSVNVTPLAIPMQQITTPHGNFVQPPANLAC